MRYRAEIDGLRAVAVVPVILFHAGFETFSGGFVGVDIFFVISGYLITSIIMSDLSKGSFSLRNFYERRAKRILPTLFFVMATCIPFAWFLLLPADMKDFSQSVVATSLFSSNILFWLESGYFDRVAELKPFLHTWSLAVEEQYYILFPLCLMFTWKFGKTYTVAMLVGFAIFSLGLAHWAVYHMPSAAFYLLPTRAWEILIGALVAFYLDRKNTVNIGRIASEVVCVGGLALIASSIFLYSKEMPFPGLFALAPTVGVSLVILFIRKDTIVCNILSRPAVAGVGLISYSAYLWHQPMFAFIRYHNVIEPSASVMAFLSVLIFPLAFFSWRYIERPLRRTNGIRPVFTFAGIGFVSSLFISVGLLGHFSSGFDKRVPPDHLDQRFFADLSVRMSQFGVDGERCISETASMCRVSYGHGKRVLLVGDSHSADFSLDYKEYVDQYDLNAWQMSVGGCGFIPSHFRIHGGECKKAVEKLKEIIKTDGLDEIIFISNHYNYLRRLSVNEAYKDVTFLKSMLIAAIQNGIDVTYFTPRPTFSVPPAQAAFSGKMKIIEKVHEPFKDMAVSIEKELSRLGVHVFDQRLMILRLSCGSRSDCIPGFVEGRPLYRDTNHLSAFGKSYIFRGYIKSFVGTPVVDDRVSG
jgi:peptidoglycan/LPS O-acetylase OafA/YrhL